MGRKDEFDPEELSAIEKLLGGMLAYEPSQRISAKDAVASEWMQKGGISGMEKAREVRNKRDDASSTFNQ